jgi:hypothetical protein
VIRHLTAFPVEEVNSKIRHTSRYTLTPRDGPSSGASEGQAQESWLQIKQELFVTLGVAKPVHGVSTFSLCLSSGQEQRTPPASAEDGNDRKRRRKPILYPWSTSDISRFRIKKHYELSHPKMWGKPMTRVVAADMTSAAAVQKSFNKNKLEAH